MESKTYKLASGNLLEVIRDTNAAAPDSDNNDIFLVYDHRSFMIKRDGFEPQAIFDAINNKTVDEEYPDWVFYLVDAYIHSGIRLSLRDSTYYPDRKWDVSTRGWVCVKKSQWDSNEARIKAAKSLLNAWNQYTAGEVYGFIILKEIKCDHCGHVDYEQLDSCWGFYGDNPKTNGMMNYIDDQIAPEETNKKE